MDLVASLVCSHRVRLRKMQVKVQRVKVDGMVRVQLPDAHEWPANIMIRYVVRQRQLSQGDNPTNTKPENPAAPACTQT